MRSMIYDNFVRCALFFMPLRNFTVKYAHIQEPHLTRNGYIASNTAARRKLMTPVYIETAILSFYDRYTKLAQQSL